MKRAMALATRVECDEESDGFGGKCDGNEGGRRLMATRVMATVTATEKKKKKKREEEECGAPGGAGRREGGDECAEGEDPARGADSKVDGSSPSPPSDGGGNEDGDDASSSSPSSPSPSPSSRLPTAIQSILEQTCHYDVLGITRSASSVEIQKAYRRRCVLTHPDKAPGGGRAAFDKVSEAYDVLSSEEKRAAYDRHGGRGGGLGSGFGFGGVPEDRSRTGVNMQWI